MKFKFQNILKTAALATALVGGLMSCNKELPQPQPIVPPAPATTSIIDALNDPSLSILKAAVDRAGTGFKNLISDKSGMFTFFAPTNDAFAAMGITSPAMVAAFRPGQLDTLLRYNLIGGQKLTSAAISTSFPNLQEPSSFVLAPPSAALPPGLRMPIFPSKRGTSLWVNNIPVIEADVNAGNAVIHKVPVLVAPPSQYLWERIAADTGLTYLKAAIAKADSGVAAASTLQAALQNPAANLTVFAPTNAAFKQLLTGQITMALIPMITQQLIAGGATPEDAAAQAPAMAQSQATALASTPGVFTNPALAGVLTATTVKGLVVYHILGTRAFSVNLPTTATRVPTLLNSAMPSHPGVEVKATFGTTGVTAATVKGAFNATPANVLINPTPAPGGSSDQFYINGVLHKIDQVLIPQG